MILTINTNYKNKIIIINSHLIKLMGDKLKTRLLINNLYRKIMKNLFSQTKRAEMEIIATMALTIPIPSIRVSRVMIKSKQTIMLKTSNF